MRDIIVLRHGETESTKKNQYDGNVSTPLTEKGRKQAAEFSDYVRRNCNVKKIVASSMVRAQQTAEVVSHALDLPYVEDARLNEISYQLMTGMSVSQMMVAQPEFWRKYMDDPSSISIPGWESVWDVQARAWAAIDEALSDCDGDLLILTHSMTLFAILAKVINVDIDKMLHLSYSEYCSFSHLPCEYSIIGWDNGEQVIKKRKVRNHLLPIYQDTSGNFTNDSYADNRVETVLRKAVSTANQNFTEFSEYLPGGLSFTFHILEGANTVRVDFEHGAYRCEIANSIEVVVPVFNFQSIAVALEFMSRRLLLLDQPGRAEVRVDASVRDVMKTEMFFYLVGKYILL